MGKFARLFHVAKKAVAATLELTFCPKDPCLQYTFLWADSFIALNLNTLRTGKVWKLQSSWCSKYATPLDLLYLGDVKNRIINRREKNIVRVS